MSKKLLKRIFLNLTIILSFFLSILTVKANEINNIDMNIYLDKNGNANIVETWEAHLTEGTEGYRSFSKLGNSTITNFQVTDENNQKYTSIPSWNVDANFDNKAYKSGINYEKDGLELCWGISKYGYRKYKLTYNINNLVTNYQDTQGIYFNFLNLNEPVENAKITIYTDTSLSSSNAKIWAFGYRGEITFQDGKIIMNSNGTLKTSEYMVGLIKFSDKIFNTSNTSLKTFDEIYKEALKSAKKEKIFVFFIISIVLIAFLLPIIIIIFIIKSIKKMALISWSQTLDFGPVGTTLPKLSEINYWRDIPCNKDILEAYWVCLKYNVSAVDSLKPGIIGAILLKWIRNKCITVSKTKEGLLNFKDNNYALDFSKMSRPTNKIEAELYDIITTAAGENKLLEPQEFAKWSKKNYQKIIKWYENINKVVEEELENRGLITIKNKKVTKKEISVNIREVNPKLKEEAIKMQGLKKFLLDFSSMPEKEYFEVHIWEDYLIFAMILGIATKVAEQFSKLYPKFNEISLLTTDIATIAVYNMAEACYQSSFEAYESMCESNYNFGGSGGSSFSDGGSSSGGSDGGGFR